MVFFSHIFFIQIKLHLYLLLSFLILQMLYLFNCGKIYMIL